MKICIAPDQLEWDSIPGIRRHTVRYRKLGGFHSDRHWPSLSGWPHYATPNSKSVPRSRSSTTSTRIDGLSEGEIYAFQLNYVTPSGEKVFSARDSYAWASGELPKQSSLVRVGTYPFFGYWERGRYEYAVCTHTFEPSGDQQGWSDLIDHAFEQWERAAPDAVTVSRVHGDCRSDDGRRIHKKHPMTVIRALYNESNEVYMVDASPLWMPWVFAHNKLFFCITGATGRADSGAPACVISPRYGELAWLDPRNPEVRPLDSGSVDVLINVRRSTNDEGTLDIPSDTSFNTCDGSGKFGNYELMVHESGHALGLAGFFHPLFASDRIAHPSIPDSVMNYDGDVAQIINEPDCSPHPFDIMAIEALYQTVNP